MRGEDKPQTIVLAQPSETPPHARGRRGYAQVGGAETRNTPACAGKTVARENSICRKVETPPHARGRPDIELVGLAPLGNTPACAGKTAIESAKMGIVEKHPRMRGEDSKILYLFNDLPTKYGVLIQLRGDSCRYIPTPTMRRRVAGQSISERSVGRTGSGIPQAEGMSPSNLTPGLKSVKTRQVH